MGSRELKAVSNKARRLAWTSIAETVSFIVLLAMMFLESEAGISIIGATHGFLFLAYALLMWIDHAELGWSTWSAVALVVTGPLGALIVLERLRRDRSDPEAATSLSG